MKLSLEMSNKDIYDLGSSKKGRILSLLFLSVFLLIFVVSAWDDVKYEPSFYVFMLYAITLGFFVYKYYENYYKFAKLYREKLNPNFPLTHNEAYERWIKDNKYRVSTFHFMSITFGHFNDKEIAKYAKKTSLYLIFAFCSPIAFFVLTIVVMFLSEMI